MQAELTCLEVYCIFKLERGNKLGCGVHLQRLRLTQEGRLNDACCITATQRLSLLPCSPSATLC